MFLSVHRSFATIEKAPEYHVQNFTADNGLPQNSVKSIAQDQNGFIWLATENGIVRFGGDDFYTFNNSILPIKTNRFIGFQPNQTLGDKKNTGTLYSVNDAQEYVRIENGTCQKDSSSTIFKNLPYIPSSDNEVFLAVGLPFNFKGSFRPQKYLIPTNDGGVYVKTEDSVAFYKEKKRQFIVNYRSNGYSTFFRIGNELFSNERDGSFSQISSKGIITYHLSGDVADSSIYRPEAGNYEIFFSSGNGESYLYLNKSLYLLTVSTNKTLDTKLLISGFDFDNNSIVSVFYDKSRQLLFLGSLIKGLFVFTPKHFSVRGNPSDGENNCYYAQALLADGTVITPQGDAFTVDGYRSLKTLGGSGEWERHSMLTDRENNVWVQRGDFITKLDPEGKTILKKWDIKGEITQLLEGLSGEIFIGTRNMGLFSIDPSEDAPLPKLFYRGGLGGISFLQNETSKRLWIGTDNGLFCLDTEKRKIVASVEGVKGKYIRSLYIPKPGETWISTASKGFYLLQNNRLVTFPVDQGGYLNDVHCFVEDANGYFWLPTNKGLFQVAKRDLYAFARGETIKPYYLFYNKDVGFNTNEFNGGCTPCALQLPNGSISLPSMDGLVWFDPMKVKPQFPDKPLFVENVELDGKPIAFRDTLELSRDFDQLLLNVVTPYFGNRKNIHFDYALLNGSADTTWFSIKDAKETIFISKLKYGTYHLIIRKADGFGINNYSQKVVVLVVKPAFYETGWFLSLMVFLAILTIYGLIRIRTQYLLTKNSELESRVAERTNELQQTLKVLRSSEDSLSWQTYIQERIIAAISHDIRTPLRYLCMANQELSKYIANTSDDETMVETSKSAYESALQMHHQTDTLLEYIKPQMRKLEKGPFTEVDLYSVVEEKIQVFQHIAKSNSTVISNEVPKNFLVFGIRQLCSIVLHNLLDNASKLTHNGKITIKSKKSNSKASLIIEDTAGGMPEELAEWLSDTTYSNDSQRKEPPTKTGVGLIIIKEMAHVLAIDLQVEVEESIGTRVILLFDENLSSPKNSD
jgi:signal transduction histidine kinase